MLSSRREGRVVMDNSRRVRKAPSVDPYAPGSPHYAERHRVTRLDLGNGATREDIGEPLPAERSRVTES